ncbi:MAG: hypothetical protein ACREL7_05385 [Longimicrobiales bacterium]
MIGAALTRSAHFRIFASMARTAQKAAAVPESSLRFSRINAILLGMGLAAIVAGYVLLASGSTVGAPLLLVLGYAILVPLGIIL